MGDSLRAAKPDKNWVIQMDGSRGSITYQGHELPAQRLALELRAGEFPHMTLQLVPLLIDAQLMDIIAEIVASGKYEFYEHHGSEVWVDSALKGLHRAYCLCYKCSKFHPNEENNCPKAQRLYELCVEESMVTPVWECPEFSTGNLPKLSS